MNKVNLVTIDTDVLIIGGGLAGCMAAIKAAETKDLQVTLVDKSNTIASGCAASGIDHLWAYIPPIHEKMGYSIEDMAEDHRIGMAGGFFRKDLFMLVASTIYERVLDLERFGINFRYEDSKAPGKFRIVPQFHSVPTSFNFDGKPLKTKLTAEAKRRGVKIINRVQMTDLITTKGQISGAVGVGTRTGDVYSFRTKAAVLASGRINRISRNPTGVDFNTRLPSPFSGDGASMATRAGISTINAEFLSNRLIVPCANYSPNYGDPKNTVQPAARIIDGEGNVLVSRDYFYDWEKLGIEPLNIPENRRKWMEDFRKWHIEKRSLSKRIANGEGPFYLDMSEATDEEKDYIRWSISNEAKGTQFLRYFEDEEGLDLRENAQEYAGWGDRELAGFSGKGIWIDKETETEIRNLFASGDEVGGFPFQSAPGAIAMGWYAGNMAAKRAREEKSLLPAGDNDAMKTRRQLCHDILTRKQGFYWKEVELYVQHVIDFYCGSVRGEGLLQRGLERLDYARQQGIFRAENPHELARALEVMSIIDNAELVFRSSIERKESRPSHGFLRSDYPEQDDKNFFVFLAISKENGDFVIERKPIA